MKGLCKEDNGEGRWETAAFSGCLWSALVKKKNAVLSAKQNILTHVLGLISLFMHT